MTYMTYNFFFALMTLLPVLIWFGLALWVILDADKMPTEAWRLAGESKNVWIALSILLMWPFGFIFYFFVVRKKVAGFARTINEDVLIGKAADRLRKESYEDRGAYAAHSESHIPEDRDYEVESHKTDDRPAFEEGSDSTWKNVADDTKTHDDVDETPKSSDNGVFDYEESDARDDFRENEQTIPPKPDYAPTVSDRDYEAEKTAAYPVVPPKPTHAPRVGNDGVGE